MVDCEQGEYTSHEFLNRGDIVSERFRVLGLISSGSRGAIYLAEDLLLERLVALKVVHPDLMTDRETQRRFLREVAVTRIISHPNIVRTFDIGRYRSLLYYSMEYVEGRSLREYARSVESLSYSRIARIALQVLAGLDAVHNHRVFHRGSRDG